MLAHIPMKHCCTSFLLAALLIQFVTCTETANQITKEKDLQTSGSISNPSSTNIAQSKDGTLDISIVPSSSALAIPIPKPISTEQQTADHADAGTNDIDLDRFLQPYLTEKIYGGRWPVADSSSVYEQELNEFKIPSQNDPEEYIILPLSDSEKRFMRGFRGYDNDFEIDEDKRFMRGFTPKRDGDFDDVSDDDEFPNEHFEDKRFLRGFSNYAKKEDKRFMRGFRNLELGNGDHKRFIVGLNRFTKVPDKRFMRGFSAYNKRFIYGLQNYGKRFMRGLVKRDDNAVLENEKRFIVGLNNYGRRADNAALTHGNGGGDKRFMKGFPSGKRFMKGFPSGKRFMKGFRQYDKKSDDGTVDDFFDGDNDLSNNKRFMRGFNKKYSNGAPFDKDFTGLDTENRFTNNVQDLDKRFIKGLVKKSDDSESINKRFIKGLVKKSDDSESLDKKFIKGLVKKSDEEDKRFIKGLVKKSDDVDVDKRFIKGLVKKSDGEEKRFIKGLVKKSDEVDKRFIKGLIKKSDEEPSEDKRFIKGLVRKSDGEDKRFIKGLIKKSDEEGKRFIKGLVRKSEDDKRFIKGLNKKSDDEASEDKRFNKGLVRKSDNDKRFIKGLVKKSDEEDKRFIKGLIKKTDEEDLEDKRFIKGLVRKSDDDKRFMRGLIKKLDDGEDKRFMRGFAHFNNKRFMRGFAHFNNKRFMRGFANKRFDDDDDVLDVNDKKFMRGLHSKKSSINQLDNIGDFSIDNQDLDKKFNELSNDYINDGNYGNLYIGEDGETGNVQEKRFIKGLNNYVKKNDNDDDGAVITEDKRFMRGFNKKDNIDDNVKDDKRFIKGLVKKEVGITNNDNGSDKRFMRGLVKRESSHSREKRNTRFRDENDADVVWRLVGNEDGDAMLENPYTGSWYDLPVHETYLPEKRFMRGLGQYTKRDYDDIINEFDDDDDSYDDEYGISKRFLRGLLNNYGNNGRDFLPKRLTDRYKLESTHENNKRFIKGLDIYTKPINKRFMRGLQFLGPATNELDKRFIRGLDRLSRGVDKRFIRGLGNYVKRPIESTGLGNFYTNNRLRKRSLTGHRSVVSGNYRRKPLGPSFRHSQISHFNGEENPAHVQANPTKFIVGASSQDGPRKLLDWRKAGHVEG